MIRPPGTTARRSRGFAEVGSGVIALAYGLALTALIVANSDGPGSFRSVGSLAFGALLCQPGVLAVLARRRPALYLAVAVESIPLGFVSMAGIALPLIIPGAMALVAYARRARRIALASPRR